LFTKSFAAASSTGAGGFLDAYRSRREPSPRQLLDEWKGLAWACASINATSCASYPPKLYVRTAPAQPLPKCANRPLHPRQIKSIGPAFSPSAAVAEVTDHPLLDLFRSVNPEMNAFDLWEVTQLYLEVLGVAYWYPEVGPLGTPVALWPLPAQHV